MKSKTYRPSSNDPVWLEEGHRINEAVLCETFMSTHKIVFCNGFFFYRGWTCHRRDAPAQHDL